MPLLQNPRQPVGEKLIVTPGYQAVPATPTVLTTKDCSLFAIYVTNTTAGAITLTLTDGNGLVVLNPAIEAKTSYYLEALFAAWCAGGLTWGASGVGLNADMILTTRIGASS